MCSNVLLMMSRINLHPQTLIAGFAEIVSAVKELTTQVYGMGTIPAGADANLVVSACREVGVYCLLIHGSYDGRQRILVH